MSKYMNIIRSLIKVNLVVFFINDCQTNNRSTMSFILLLFIQINYRDILQFYLFFLIRLKYQIKICFSIGRFRQKEYQLVEGKKEKVD